MFQLYAFVREETSAGAAKEQLQEKNTYLSPGKAPAQTFQYIFIFSHCVAIAICNWKVTKTRYP